MAFIGWQFIAKTIEPTSIDLHVDPLFRHPDLTRLQVPQSRIDRPCQPATGKSRVVGIFFVHQLDIRERGSPGDMRVPHPVRCIMGVGINVHRKPFAGNRKPNAL